MVELVNKTNAKSSHIAKTTETSVFKALDLEEEPQKETLDSLNQWYELSQEYEVFGLEGLTPIAEAVLPAFKNFHLKHKDEMTVTFKNNEGETQKRVVGFHIDPHPLAMAKAFVRTMVVNGEKGDPLQMKQRLEEYKKHPNLQHSKHLKERHLPLVAALTGLLHENGNIFQDVEIRDDKTLDFIPHKENRFLEGEMPNRDDGKRVEDFAIDMAPKIIRHLITPLQMEKLNISKDELEAIIECTQVMIDDSKLIWKGKKDKTEKYPNVFHELVELHDQVGQVHFNPEGQWAVVGLMLENAARGEKLPGSPEGYLGFIETRQKILTKVAENSAHINHEDLVHFLEVAWGEVLTTFKHHQAIVNAIEKIRLLNQEEQQGLMDNPLQFAELLAQEIYNIENQSRLVDN